MEGEGEGGKGREGKRERDKSVRRGKGKENLEGRCISWLITSPCCSQLT